MSCSTTMQKAISLGSTLITRVANWICGSLLLIRSLWRLKRLDDRVLRWACDGSFGLGSLIASNVTPKTNRLMNPRPERTKHRLSAQGAAAVHAFGSALSLSAVNLTALVPRQRRTAGFLQRHPEPFFEDQIAVELLDGTRIRLFVLSKLSVIDWLPAKHADEHVVLALG